MLLVCVPHTTHKKKYHAIKNLKNTVPPSKEEVIKLFTEKQVLLENSKCWIGIKEWQDAAEKWIINKK